MGAGVLAALLGLAIVESADVWWGDWFGTGGTIHDCLSLALPISAGLACWQGGLEARAGTAWTGECSVRGPWANVLLSLAPSVLWPLTVFGTSVLVMSAATWSTAPVGRPPFAMAAYAVAMLSTMVGAGHVLGCLLPLRIVPPLVGAPLVWGRIGGDILGFEHPTYRSYAGPPLPDHTWETYEDPVPLWLPWAALALIITAALTVLAFRARVRLTAGLLLLVLVPCAAVRPWQGGVLETGVGTIAVRCSNGTPVVCLSADREAQRDQLTGVADHFSRRLDGVRGAPTHYLATADTGFDRFFDAGTDGWTAEIQLGTSGTTRFRTVAGHIAEPDWFYDPAYEDSARSALVMGVTDWLLPAQYRPKDRPPRVRRLTARLTALPEPARTAWLSRYLSAVQNEADRLPQLPKAATP